MKLTYVLGVVCAAGAAFGEPETGPKTGPDTWVAFEKATDDRLIADPALGVDDVEEKDYAWGDVDNDGDNDLIVARKQPWSTPGRRVNVLFINEGLDDGHPANGVLVDRTAEYATASDVGGDQGFLTPTSDRDIILVDVDVDGWLDVVTAVAQSDGQPKHISHPRVYMNLGANGKGDWLGFRYEDARIPLLHESAGPRFASVVAGDVTGDGFPDLYFGDYDLGGPEEFDFNNILLVNDGAGFFFDATKGAMTEKMINSAFSGGNAMADVNGDGALDIIKQDGLTFPVEIAILYNDPDNLGVFTDADGVYSASPLHVAAGDLNNDGRVDIAVTDDGADRYLLNQGNNPDGFADFNSFVYTYQEGGDDGFGGNCLMADLNRDGWLDVLIADIDLDISGCNRRLHIYHNLADIPTVTLRESALDVIPADDLKGVHDVAAFDINGDGWLDMVIGRCTGTDVWLNQPLTIFSYPRGRPEYVPSGGGASVLTKLAPPIGTTPETVTLHYAVDGGEFQTAPMTALGDNQFEGVLPSEACEARITYFLSAVLDDESVVVDPLDAPAETYRALVADTLLLQFLDEVEGDVSGWTIENDPSLQTGAWEQADPNATFAAGGQAAPEDDATEGKENTMCFVTENGPKGGSASANDVDGGPTWLTSPAMNLDVTTAVITFSYWFYSSEAGQPGAEDFFTVEVSGDGETWTLVDQFESLSGQWREAMFLVNDFITPTETVFVRFSTSDDVTAPGSSVVEAGIDNFRSEILWCNDVACRADLTDDGEVGPPDLAVILGSWGPNPGHPADLDGDGIVGPGDLAIVLGSWGPC